MENQNFNQNFSGNFGTGMNGNFGNQGFGNQGFRPQQGQQQNKEQQPDREPLRIKVEPLEFDGELKSKMIKTSELGGMITTMLRAILSDYQGCIIVPDNSGQLRLFLYFKDHGYPIPEGKYKCLRSALNMNKNASSFEKINFFNMRNRMKTYDLTDDAKELLSEFIPTKPGEKIKWDKLMIEKTQQEIGSYSVMVELAGLDLNRVVRKLYGARENKARLDYSVSLVRPLTPVNCSGQFNPANAIYLVNVLQMNNEQVAKLANTVGFVPTNGQIPMY